MSFTKRRFAVALAVVAVASLVTFLQVEANHEIEDQIGDRAVWSASADDLNTIGQTCKNPDAAGYSECFIEQMGGLASSDAVAFTQLLAAQKSPRLGYLAGLRESGLVDLGYVVYPGSTDPGRGWVLLNGIPALVNLDDLSMLPKAEMEKDARFSALKKNHPQMQLGVDNDERMPDKLPQVEQLADGGERFVIPYSLKETCSGCPALARASFGFDFDGAGRFLGVKFLSIE